MFGFGSWLMVSNFMIAVFNQFYRFFIGKTFSSEQLGLYDRAQQFESMIADTFTWVIAQVAFPVFSKIQDDTKEIEKTIVGFIRFSTFVVFPLLAILFVISEPLILLLLTEKWAKTISLLKSFCLVGLMKPIYKFFGPMLQGLGHSKLDMMFTALLSIGRVLNVLITYRHGLQYIIIGEFFVLLFGIIIISICAKNKINFNFLTLFWVVKWNGVATLIITVLGLFLISLPKTHIFQILFSSLTMGLAYLAIMRIFDKNLFFSLKSIILKQNRN
jgi:O-antigen/teichoic acid export membrane protein